jgi:ABC-type glycerol-3-phosphate transport system permease component
MKSDITYRSQTILRNFCVYALLLGGALVFSWPFLWMATTSFKVDREMFAEGIRLWPQRPIPATRSPYAATRYYRDVSGEPMGGLTAIVKRQLAFSAWGTWVPASSSGHAGAWSVSGLLGSPKRESLF